jgi:hypothetical protein
MKTNLNNIKGSGFKVPKDYFHDLEAKIMSNTQLKSSVPTSGFEVPDTYFENLEDVILNKVKTKPKVISLFSKRHLIYVSSMAAAVVLLISVFNRPQEEFNFDAIETASIENYLFEEGLAKHEIASLLSEADLEDFGNGDVDISDESLETYVLKNIDVEDIIEQ